MHSVQQLQPLLYERNSIKWHQRHSIHFRDVTRIFFVSKEMIIIYHIHYVQTIRIIFGLIYIDILIKLPRLENPANTYIRNTEQVFQPYWVSSAVHTVISTTRDRTSNTRIRNSTTGPPVHATHKRCQINQS